MPVGIGLDNECCLEQQNAAILDRAKQFGSRLYLEFSGKLLFDYHAARLFSRPD